MAMNRFVGLGILALSAMAVSFAACDDSATSVAAAGGAVGSVGGAAAGLGGAAAGLGGAAAGLGGAVTGLGGAVTGVGGGGVTPTGSCTAATNILAGMEPTGNWVGGDPASKTDDPCGVQGAVYGYGDGTSCTVPDATTICAAGKCKISGTTIVDTTYAAWGCGIGIDLQNSGAPADTKSQYAGPAKGFIVNTSGDLGGIGLRVQYKTNIVDDTIASPFKPFTATGPLSVTFAEATCPTGWGAGCAAVSGTGPYSLQVQIVGAELAASYTLSIDSITPIL